jgi:hypothetical protein
LAIACERLIADGHSDPFSYTPKSVFAFSELSRRRRNVDLLNNFSASLIAARGKEKDIKKFVRELKSGKI